jgi:hypothetical protein
MHNVYHLEERQDGLIIWDVSAMDNYIILRKRNGV